MIRITAWNEGFETHDTRKTRGALAWVRQPVMVADVRWARLWTRGDAAQVWAGWTALVWFASQADERGTVTNAEDVSLLSRVPLEWVEAALDWAQSVGLAESTEAPGTSPATPGNPPANLPQHRDDCPATPDQSSRNAGSPAPKRRVYGRTDVTDETGRDVTGQNGQNAETRTSAPASAPARERRHSANFDKLDPRKMPDRISFVAWCGAKWPEWRSEFPAALWDRWFRAGWKVPSKTTGNPEKIANWQALTTDFRKGADPAEIGDRFLIGTALQALVPDLSSMRFQP